MSYQYRKVTGTWRFEGDCDRPVVRNNYFLLDNGKVYSVPLGRGSAEIGDVLAVDDDSGEIDFSATPVPGLDVEFSVLGVTKSGLIRAVENNRELISDPDEVISKIMSLTTMQMKRIAGKLTACYLREYDFYEDISEILKDGYIEVKMK